MDEQAVAQPNRPLRVCPEAGCGHAEQATLVIHTERPWWRARTKIVREFRWNAEHCPRDGNTLVGDCSCGALLAETTDLCCRACGKPFWWQIQIGDEPVADWASPENMLAEIGRTRIFGVRESITNIVADAVVSSDDARGAMRSQSAVRLKEAGGPEIESESMSTPRALGGAWVTNAGQLHARHVIHVGLLDAGSSTTEQIVRDCLRNSLRRADEQGVQTIAYPALATGRSGFPMDQSARLAHEEIRQYVDDNPRGSLAQIAFVLFVPEQLTAFRAGFVPSPVKEPELM